MIGDCIGRETQTRRDTSRELRTTRKKSDFYRGSLAMAEIISEKKYLGSLESW